MLDETRKYMEMRKTRDLMRTPEFEKYDKLFDSDTYGFPLIAPFSGVVPERLVAYNQITETLFPEDEASKKNSAVHFYLSDYKIESAWKWQERSLEKIARVGIAISPDFSIVDTFPLPVKMYNKYRNHWLAAFWQSQGLQVISNVPTSWDENTYMMLSGFPRKSVIALSSVGQVSSRAAKEYFCHRFEILVDFLEPTDVILHGVAPDRLMQTGYNLHVHDTYRDRVG